MIGCADTTQEFDNSTTPRSASILLLPLLLACLLQTTAALSQHIDREMFKTLSSNETVSVSQMTAEALWEKGKSFSAADKYSDALYWYERAAQKGNADAAYEIGLIYDHALSDTYDPVMALRWYKLAADEKNTLAIQRLAGFSLHGAAGVPKDPKKTVELLEYAYSLGNSDVAFGLAKNYKTGFMGIPQNAALSALWRQKYQAEIDKADSICSNKLVLNAMQDSMTEMVRKGYTSETGMIMLGVMAATNMTVSTPSTAREAHKVTAIHATSHLDHSAAECEAGFASDPTYWSYQVYRISDAKGERYLVLPASGSQWFQLQAIRANFMVARDDTPIGLHNLHDFDPPPAENQASAKDAATTKNQPSAPSQEESTVEVSLPPVIHECDVNCLTLTLENGQYIASHQRWEPPNLRIVWSVESFTPQLVALHRTYPVDQVFRGQISPDGNTLINITYNGRPGPGIKIAWGAALSTVFANNEERDRAKK